MQLQANEFKKKCSRNGNGGSNKRYEGILDLLKGIGFTITRDGPDLYLKALKRLDLYVCTTYKNGSNLEMCLEKLILPKEPVLKENPMAHQQKMWDLHATALIKNEETLRQNRRFLYAVVMSLCDSNMEDKIKAHEDYAEVKHTRNTIKLLQVT